MILDLLNDIKRWRDIMNDSQIIKELGVCGLDCSRCVACKEGEVQRLSSHLKESLMGFDKKAVVFSNFVPTLKQYTAFEEVLDFFVNAACGGCRTGQCMAPGCVAKDCHKEKKVDFCFQCDEYPCSRNTFSDEIYQKWRANNDLMKDIGIKAFYEKSKTKARY